VPDPISCSVERAEELVKALRDGFARGGPGVIEVVL